MSRVKGGFTFWRTYWDVAQELSEKQQGEFYRAIVQYMFTDQDPEGDLKGTVRICFKAVKPNLKTSARRSESGEAGGKQSASKRQANSKQYQDKDKDKYQYQGEDDEPLGVTPMPPSARRQLEERGLIRRVK